MSEDTSNCQEFWALAQESSIDSIKKISKILEDKSSDTFDKHILPYRACYALLYKGKPGIDKLVELLDKVDSHIYSMAILRSLWAAGEGRLVPSLFSEVCKEFNQPLSQEISSYAHEVFLNFILKCQVNPDMFYRLTSFLYTETMHSLDDKAGYINFHKSIFNLLTESTIKISKDLIDNFQKLIESEVKEEEYQLFIEEHPVLINPLAMNVIDKHKLGTEYITDYIIETLTEEYILVEIEKPQDKIFTKAGEFSSQFSHAFGQVLDFIDWIENNIAYARTKLPNITSPKGLLIMGRNNDLTEEMRRKLRRFNHNSNSIEVLTYDDLLSRAMSLYSNIKRKIEIQE